MLAGLPIAVARMLPKKEPAYRAFRLDGLNVQWPRRMQRSLLPQKKLLSPAGWALLLLLSRAWHHPYTVDVKGVGRVVSVVHWTFPRAGCEVASAVEVHVGGNSRLAGATLARTAPF